MSIRLLENQFLKDLTSKFDHSPNQINNLFESDSELVRLNNGQIIAITTDNISEEIETGLYHDPYLQGWMSAIVSLSDLAAVGSNPLGILSTLQVPQNIPNSYLESIQSGISDACTAHNTFVLGGDTNYCREIVIGSTALGIINDKRIMSRKGCKTGDILFTSGRLGSGGALGIETLLNKGKEDLFDYKPFARLDEGEVVRTFGGSCIDTSDGFFPAISNLMEINGIGFQVTSNVKNLVLSKAADLANLNQIPLWFLLAGPHGEFELLFTIPKKNISEFLKAAERINWAPLNIGHVITEQKLYFINGEHNSEIDPFIISNLFSECNGDINIYLKELYNVQTDLK